MAPPTTRKESRDAIARQSPTKQSVRRAYARPKRKRRQSPTKGGKGRTKYPKEMGVPDDSEEEDDEEYNEDEEGNMIQQDKQLVLPIKGGRTKKQKEMGVPDDDLEDEEDTEYNEDKEGKMIGQDKQQQEQNMVNDNKENESNDSEEFVENQQNDKHNDDDEEEQESPSKSISSALTNEERLKIIRKRRRESNSKEKMKDKKVRKVIRLLKEDYFRKVKFVSNDKEIKALMNAIKVDPKCNGIFNNLNEKEFESRYFPFVKQTMTTKRGTCAQEMGKMVKEKIDELDGDTSKIPSSAELARLRQGKDEHWFWFAGTLLETVAGVRNGWGQEKYFIHDIAQAKDTKGRTMVSITDEALTLLLYDNYIEKWIERYKNGWNERVSGRKMGKYSSSASGEQGRSGWSKEGMKKFNEYVNMVRASRAHETTPEKEHALMVFLQSTEKGQRVVQRANHVSSGRNNEFGDDSNDDGASEEEDIEVYNEL